MIPGTVPCHQEPYRFSSFSTYLFPSVALNLPKDGSDPVVNIKSVFFFKGTVFTFPSSDIKKYQGTGIVLFSFVRLQGFLGSLRVSRVLKSFCLETVLKRKFVVGSLHGTF